MASPMVDFCEQANLSVLGEERVTKSDLRMPANSQRSDQRPGKAGR